MEQDHYLNNILPPIIQDKLSKSVNMRAMNMLGKAEEKVWRHCSAYGMFLIMHGYMYTILCTHTVQ